MVPVDFTHAFETVIASKIFISFLLGKCNIYFNMKTSKIYESDNKWCIGILVLLVVHIHFVVCGKVRESFDFIGLLKLSLQLGGST
jgi:hypothetical protein